MGDQLITAIFVWRSWEYLPAPTLETTQLRCFANEKKVTLINTLVARAAQSKILAYSRIVNSNSILE